MPTLHLLLAAVALVTSPAPTAAVPPSTSAPAAEEALRALAAAGVGEPGIGEVQRAAAREAERALGSGGTRRRGRLAALLPRLTTEVRLDQSSTRVVGLQGSGEVDYLRLEPGTAVVIRATWDLRDLAGAPGEPAVPPAAARIRAREAAVQRATTLFYERRRALLALLLAPPAAPLARAQAELEIDRLGAELDAMTGGLLGRGDRP